jgi:hypothetical protein
MRDQSARGTNRVAGGFAVRRALTRMAHSPELGARSMFSDLRAALEGKAQEKESRLS